MYKDNCLQELLNEGVFDTLSTVYEAILKKNYTPKPLRQIVMYYKRQHTIK
jgi:hypothetical protein